MNQAAAPPFLRHAFRIAVFALCVTFSIGWLAFPDLVRRGRNFAATYLRLAPDPMPVDLSSPADRPLREAAAVSPRRFAALAEPEQGKQEGNLLRPVASLAPAVESR